ncbi:MAG: ABC transporter permease subunit [Candidatus Dojkabacteria bacterium]|nr:ABC transporter permease subunit [Candidatus Dojkabacteria bacterium]
MNIARSIYFKNLWNRKFSIIAWSLGFAIIAIMFAALYESSAGEITSYAESIPKSFESFIGDLSSATTPNGWINIELYSLFLPIIGVNLGASAIGSEEENRTLDLILSRPVSRTKFIIEKELSIITNLSIISFVLYTSLLLGKLVYSFDIDKTNVFWATFSALVLGLSFANFALMMQNIKKKKSSGIGYGALFVTVSYLTHVFSQLSQNLEFLKHISTFYYYNVKRNSTTWG